MSDVTADTIVKFPGRVFQQVDVTMKVRRGIMMRDVVVRCDQRALDGAKVGDCPRFRVRGFWYEGVIVGIHPVRENC